MEISDIHTHHDSPHAIINTAPSLYSPKDGKYYSVGIHPWSVIPNYEDQWSLLQKAAADSQVLAIGEAGIDKLRNKDTALQTEVFFLQAELAEQLNKPLIIHSVRSSNELVCLKKKCRTSVAWIIHGFRGNERVASTLIEQGFYLSFGEKYQPGALKAIPLHKCFMETDESPKNINDLYKEAATVLELPQEELICRIQQNIKDVFFRR